MGAVTTCPKCAADHVPVYQLGLPPYMRGGAAGAIHLAAHDCPKGGDHILIQERVVLDREQSQ